MPTTCCVVMCGSRGDRDDVSFYKIPSELHFAHKKELNELSKRRRQKWIQAIKREDLTETKIKNGRVCSKHFPSGKPSALTDESNPNWVPCFAMGYGKDEGVRKRIQIEIAREGRAAKRRQVIEDVSQLVTEDFTHTQTEEDTEEDQLQREFTEIENKNDRVKQI